MFQAPYGVEGAQRREAVALSNGFGAFASRGPLQTPRALLLYAVRGSQLPGLPSQSLWRSLGLPPGLQVLSVNPTFISK